MSKAQTKTVLILGDWTVDENWVVEPGHSASSAEPIEAYYRSIAGRGHSVLSLCGAGRVARALHWMNRWHVSDQGLPTIIPSTLDAHRLNLVCVGLWARNDDDHLVQLFLPDAGRSRNPYELRGTVAANSGVPTKSEVALLNLADYLSPNQLDSEFCTPHGYQVFRRRNGLLNLFLRLDWHRPAAPFHRQNDYREWELPPATAVELRQKLAEFTKKIDAIVVKCLGAGVVSESLVRLVADVFPKVPWFVSSALGARALWIEALPPGTLRLLFLPPRPLSREGFAAWRTVNSLPSREADEYLAALVSRYRPYLANAPSAIVAMPSGLSVLAACTTSRSNDGQVQRYFSTGPKALAGMTGRVGKASVYFAGLVANMLFAGEQDFGVTLERAARRTHTWRCHEEERLIARHQRSEVAYGPNLLTDDDGNDSVDYRILTSVFEESNNAWMQSKSRLGIVQEPSGQPCFHLWRGMSAAQGYIALTERRRLAVTSLHRIIHRFAETQPPPAHSVSCLLLDRPGRGKSALVNGLASSLNVDYRKIDLSQVSGRPDLLAQLDGILTDQADRQRRFLIFVDEVDSGTRWYGHFLAPVDSGLYIRGDNAFRLQPCVWVFAASKEIAELEKREKFGDFRSRLSEGVIQLSDPEGETTAADPALERLERVYVAVSFMRDRFPELRAAAVGVLYTFWRISLSVEIRRLRHLVDGIRDVEDDVILERNVSFIEDKLEPRELCRPSDGHFGDVPIPSQGSLVRICAC